MIVSVPGLALSRAWHMNSGRGAMRGLVAKTFSFLD